DVRALLETAAHRLPPDLRAALAAADDEAVADLARLAGVAALREDAPLGDGVTPARATALAAAHRVADGVHRGAADLGTAAHVALAAGLAEDDEVRVDVADLADRRAAVEVDVPHLARGERHERPLRLARREDRAGARRAHHLRAAAGDELD